MAILVLYSKFRLRIPGLLGGWQTSHWHFFFLGAAFLLLEVQNISKASVALGNTWWVNAVIISGILMMILLSNVIVARFPALPMWPVAACLIGSCLGLYFVDLSRFAFLPFATKAALIGTLTTLPMLFSGILFIQSFARVERKDVALGANLIGALVGGMLQSITFAIGIKALLLIVAALYAAAVLLHRVRSKRQANRTIRHRGKTNSIIRKRSTTKSPNWFPSSKLRSSSLRHNQLVHATRYEDCTFSIRFSESGDVQIEIVGRAGIGL